MGLTLRNYQKRICNFIVDHPHACVSVGMGLGKTACALHVLDHIKTRCPQMTALIVAPKRVAETVWMQEAEKWGFDVRNHMALVSGTPAQRAKAAQSAEILVVSRDNIADFAGQTFDILVIDELTSFKTRTAKRTDAILSIKAGRKIGLTGTIAPNGLIDLFSQMAALDMAGHAKGDWYAWRGRFFENIMEGSGQPFKKFRLRPGVTAEQVLEPWRNDIITLTTEDWLELPEMMETVMPVELADVERDAYMDLNAVLHFEMPDGLDFTASDKGKFAKLQTLCGGFVYDTETGEALRLDGGGTKIRASVEFCERCAAEGESVLLFYQYRESAVWFGELAKEAGLRIASTSSKGWLERWNNGDLDVLVANPTSAGHGLNLQHGGHVVLWMELTYNYEHYAQANARLHRTGQLERVRCYYLVAKGTVDERILPALKKKAEVNRNVQEMTKGETINGRRAL